MKASSNAARSMKLDQRELLTLLEAVVGFLVADGDIERRVLVGV